MTPSISPEEWSRLEQIVDRALEENPEEWSAWLEEACAGDEALRREAAALLARLAALEGFLEEGHPGAADPSAPQAPGSPIATGDPAREPSPDPTRRANADETRPAAAEATGIPLTPRAWEGRRVGRYRVLREIGRGGTGWVFLAERADGTFERRVALKLLRPALEGSEAVHRFEAERRTLAALEHPGIARLIDAGRAPGGHPFLVTEYVEGLPIDRFCDEAGLDVEGRLGLFRQVAEAVEHAHRNLLVHRDLKPSNILVTPEGRAKLLDFGIAKSLSGRGLDSSPAGTGGTSAGTPQTLPGRRWMTPGYAAPEQITGQVPTTATDVYQLGVLLYELLVGARPFAAEEDDRARLERAVLEREPLAPSRATGNKRPWQEVGDARPSHSVGGVRPSSSVGGVPEHLRGDLDAIVLKALRKEPGARYSGVRALLDDLDARAQGRPVGARRGTVWYRARRFLRRHRLEAAAAAAVLCALLVGAGAALWQAGEARAEQDRASSARLEAESALERSRDVTAFLLDLFRETDPWEPDAVDRASAEAILALGAQRVDRLGTRPALQASLLDALASAHLRSGSLAEAEMLARRALDLRTLSPGDDGAATAESLNGLARVLKAQGRFGEAEPLHREALSLQIEDLGADHPDVARTLSLLASRLPGSRLAEAESLRERALEIRRRAFGSTHPLVAESLMDVGRTRRSLRRIDDAEDAYREALGIRREVFGAGHPNVAESMVFLADLLREFRNDASSAEDLYRTALDIQEEALGRHHPARVHALGNLARLHSERGDHETAEALLREALEIRRTAFGPAHRQVAEGLGHLGDELFRQGRIAEAEALHRTAVAMWEQVAGPDHWAVSGALYSLGLAVAEDGRADEAARHLARAVEIRRAAMGDDEEMIEPLLAALAKLQAATGGSEGRRPGPA